MNDRLRRRERPSLRKLAERANVSPSTVSRALAGKEGVSEETRTRLMAMAHEMGLIPVVDGVRIDGRQTVSRPDGVEKLREISALLLIDSRANLGLVESVREPFYMEVLAALYEGGERYRTRIQMTPVHNDDMLEAALGRPYDGVIWLGYDTADGFEPWFSRLQEQGIPVVLCDHYIPELSCDAVVSDNFSGAYDAGAYVGALGHRRVSILQQKLSSVAAYERTRGFVAGLASAGVSPADIHITDAVTSFEGGYEGLDAALDFGATAVLCGNDTMALGVIRRASERGLHVPGELSVVGFDDLSTSSRVTPSLTTVRVHKRLLGIETVRRLFLRVVERAHDIAAFDGDDAAPLRSVVPTRLIHRESSGRLDRR